MRPVTVSVTGVGASAVIPIDQYQGPTSIGLGAVIGAGCTATVQHTFDDVFSSTFNPATAKWFDHPTMAAMVADEDGNYSFPPRGVRLNQTAGANTSTLTLVQAGAVG